MGLLDSRPHVYYADHPGKNPYPHVALTESDSIRAPKLITGKRSIIT